MRPRYLTTQTKMVNAGKYTHEITIRNPSTSRDAMGGVYGTGTTLATVWAEKQDWTGSEANENGQDTTTLRTKFIIRYRADVLPKMQVVHGSDVYDIEVVMEYDGTKRETTLECRKIAT
jgi:SPP1 family predicted phage head-tail adaptor